MSRASRFRSSSIAFRRSSTRLLLDDAAVMERERRLPRNRFKQLDAPPLVVVSFLRGNVGQRQPSEGALSEHERRRDSTSTASLARRERANRRRKARIVRCVLDRLDPSGTIGKKMILHALARIVLIAVLSDACSAGSISDL